MKNSNLEEIETSPKKRENWSYDYVVNFSKFLNYHSISANNIKINQNKISNDMAVLAEFGDIKALTFYLTNIDANLLDKNLVEMAKQIEKKPSPKTPEEWEVIAALHSLDPVFVKDDVFSEFPLMIDEEIIRVRRAIKIMSAEMRLCDEGIHNERVPHISCSALQDTEYIKAIKNAQIGYYSRFIETNNLLDLCSYLETCDGVLKLYEDYKLKNEISNNSDSGYQNYANILKNARKKNKANPNFAEEFAIARGLDLIANTSVGCVCFNWYQKKFEELANFPISKKPEPSL